MLDWELMWESLPALLQGLVVTLELSLTSLAVGLVLALGVAFARIAKNPLLRIPALCYITFFRGTPLLVQIFLLYYGIAQFEWVKSTPLWPLVRDAYACAVIAFSLNTAAYTGEILRGAIEAIPRGEVEAAEALGMSRLLVLRLVLLPRAFRLALPAYGNEVILLVKSSSLASTITLLDITGTARTIVARTYAPYELFLVAGALYLALTFVISRAIALAEWYFATERAAAAADAAATPRRQPAGAPPP